MPIVTMASIGHPKLMAGIFSLDNLCLAWKTPLLVRVLLVSFVEILLETSKISALWDNGWEFPPITDVHVMSVCSPLVESNGISLAKTMATI